MDRTNRRNYYRILHVQPDAPPAVIRSSYRTMMQRLRMHPDLGGDHWNAALINEAYEVLSDPARRAEYDRARPDLRRPGTPAEPAQPAGRPGPGAGAGRATGDRLLDACPFCHASTRGPAVEEVDARCQTCGSPLTRATAPGGTTDWRRLVARVPKHLHLRFWSRWPDRDGYRGEVLDLSLTGVRFAAPQPQGIDQFLKLDSTAFQAVARVVRCAAAADGQWEIAAEFLTLRFERARGSFFSDEA
jgi:curved DNA-binding protein CbpA